MIGGWVLWLRRQMPERGRGAFVLHWAGQALAPKRREEDRLYQTALEVEQDEMLMAEMAEWDSMAADGLGGTHCVLEL